MRHQFSTLAELFDYSTSRFPLRKASGFVEGGQTYTYSMVRDRCDNLSRILATFGVGAGDKVAIFSENMPNWTVAFFATTAFGRIAVPMLPDLSPSEVENILRHSEAKALFVSPRMLPKVSQELRSGMRLVINLEDFSLLESAPEAYTCDGKVDDPTPSDTAAIIYTSGTTGNAKGVMLSHRNFCANIDAAWHAHRLGHRDVALSILPMAHTYELSLGMLYPFAAGGKVFYLQKPPTPTILLDALKRVRPTMMCTVPLIIEKIYKTSVKPVMRRSRAMRYMHRRFPAILYLLVGRKLRKTFGGRIRFYGIGGAKLDTEVEKFLKRARFPYAIGYGLTETAPLICNAGPRKTSIGTTGVVAYGCTVRLEDVNPETGAGQIVVKGPNVMQGYYKDYNRTQSVLSPDGWFRTGDLAKVDKKGRYSICGRLGSVIIGASGENIYPEEIEQVINQMGDVNESLVVRRGSSLVALVQLNENVIDWNLEGSDKLVKDIEERRAAILDFVNSKVSRFSKISKVEFTKRPFSKTATQKIRRFLYEDKDSGNGPGPDSGAEGDEA